MSVVILHGSFIIYRRISLFSVLSFVYAFLAAQTGAPLLTNFSESTEIEDQNWAICQDINRVMLFANRKGILAFDGYEWQPVRMPAIPYTLKFNDRTGKTYVGGENTYGIIEKDQKGNYNFHPLSGDSTDVGFITRILFTDSTVYFYGDHSISRHSLNDEKLELRLMSSVNYDFTGMFNTPGHTFINVKGKGLHRLDSDTLFPIVTGYLTEKEEISFSLPYNRKLVLVGFYSGKLSLFDGIKYYNYNVRDDGYLNKNILSDGIVVFDSLYAFSTLNGGVMVIEKRTGEVRFIINNQTRLPDDEIFAMGLDRSGGLWLSHQYGLTRADLNLPVGDFSIYPGLEGNLITSLWYKNELFAATSEGVFYLTGEDENSSDKNGQVQEITNINHNTAYGEGRHGDSWFKKNRLNIFSRIFGKKIPDRKAQSRYIDPEDIPQPAMQDDQDHYPGKSRDKKQITGYVFRKIEGLDEKCRQLVPSENGILAATNRGLFNIYDHKAEIIVSGRYINFISRQTIDKKFYVGAMDGYFCVSYINRKWTAGYPDKSYSKPVYSVTVSDDSTVWLGGDATAVKVIGGRNGRENIHHAYSIEKDFPQNYIVDIINDTVFLFAETGLYTLNKTTDSFSPYKISESEGLKTRYIWPLSNLPLIKNGDEWRYMNADNNVSDEERAILKLFDKVVSVFTDAGYIWIVDGSNRLIRVDRKRTAFVKPEIDILVKRIQNERGTNFELSKIVFDRGDNVLDFEIVAPTYLKQNTTRYQYIVRKFMPDWTAWSYNSRYTLMISDPGDYTLQIRAKDMWGNVGEPKSIDFTIKPPFTRTTLFYAILGVLSVILVYLIILIRERKLRNDKKNLEQKVKERTAEIEEQKKEITSSIEYASRIQMAMLPVKEHFNTAFSDCFIIFKPRDIVSGDFYWIGEDDKHIFFTAADCTGHGVPGAFMSLLGISALNEIVSVNGSLQANTVLNNLRQKIKTSLHQTGKAGEATDGMDIAFCVLHKNRKILEYAGAYNPLFLFQNGEFFEYKADRMPIGIFFREKDSFTNHRINVRKGDIIYIFTDGYIDQFGGPDGNKFRKSNLVRLLSGITGLPMREQQQIIENELEKWRGSTPQVDDITIIGVRI